MERRVWYQTVLIHLFVKLRGRGMALGFDELIAAFRVVDGGLCKTAAELREVMTLLWCHGAYDEQLLAAALAALVPPDPEDVPGVQSLEQERDDRQPPPAESLRLREPQQELRPGFMEGYGTNGNRFRCRHHLLIRSMGSTPPNGRLRGALCPMPGSA
jgi:hypothetical protein